MCGIAGIWSVASKLGFVQSMVRAQAHRGPDSEGYFESQDYRVGMCRLSINDLHGGDQPLYSEDKNVVLLYNGEIYNSPQLREKLEADGVKFSTHSDGEVICHLYAKHKENLFELLDGMFAAALWIEDEQKLILARDIPGEKPLYYQRLENNGIAFASELKSLVAFPDVKTDLNYQAIWDFSSFLWIPEPDTIYKDVWAIPPSHMAIVTKSEFKLKPYANKFEGQPLPESDEDVIAETKRVVENSIKSRLLSDVPLGSFLSGGLDSSIVVGTAMKYVDNLSTYTIGFENLDDPYHGKADESSLAQEYADYLGTNHRTIRVTGKDFYDSLQDFCYYGDQPFAVSSGLGIMSISKAAREDGIKVLLTGDGADECFGGYSWYHHYGDQRFHNKVTTNEISNNAFSFQNFGEDLNHRLDTLAQMTPQNRAWAWHYYAHESEKKSLFDEAPFKDANTSIRHFANYNKSDYWPPKDFITQDRLFYFPYEMMRKADRMTMANSIEGRIPFASPKVLSLASKLQFKHMVKDGKLKWVLRKAFEDLLPERIFSRPKHGFNVPIDHWLKGPWKELFLHSFSEKSALYKLGMINSKTQGIAKSMRDAKNRLNGHTLFCYIMLNMWLENQNNI